MAALTADEINAKLDKFLVNKTVVHQIAEEARLFSQLKQLGGAQVLSAKSEVAEMLREAGKSESVISAILGWYFFGEA